MYIAQNKKELYEKELQRAAKDKDYLKRTIESDKDFSFVDSCEVGKDW